MEDGYAREVLEGAVDQIIVFAYAAYTRVWIETWDDWIVVVHAVLPPTTMREVDIVEFRVDVEQHEKSVSLLRKRIRSQRHPRGGLLATLRAGNRCGQVGDIPITTKGLLIRPELAYQRGLSLCHFTVAIATVK